MKKSISPLILVMAMVSEVNKTKVNDLLKIDPRNIHVPSFGDGFHFRTSTNYGDMDELKESIKQSGVVTPIEVKRAPKGAEHGKEFELVFGFRRIKACLELISQGVDLPYVPAIHSSGNDEDRLFRLFASDTSQVHLNVIEQAEAVRQLIEKGYDAKEIQGRIGKSLAYVYNLISLSKLGKKVKDQIATGDISTNAVLAIMREETDTEKVGKRIAETIKNAQKHSNSGTVKKATAADVKTVKPSTLKNPFEKLKEAFRLLDSEGVKNDNMKVLEVLLAKAPNSSVEELAEIVRGKKKSKVSKG